MKTRFVSAAGAVLLAAAAPAPSQAAPEEPVTFAEHVAPIVFANCAQCHRPGEVAPFPLLTYEDVRKRARMIAKVTASRYMPPWHPVEGHGEFAGEMRLTDAEIATLRAWVRGGMPEGDPALLPAAPRFTSGWQLGEPDLIVTMPAAFEVPAGGPDIYRNFVVPLDLDEDAWLTAVEVRPSARSVLHHIIFQLDTTGQARRADGADGRLGFSGMRGSGRAATVSGLGGWAVGGMPRHLPMGLARKLPKGSDLILRSHFHPSGKAERERTTLGLYFTDQPPTRTMVGLQLPPLFGFAAGLDVPPGEKDFRLEDSFTLPVAAQAVTVGGHAHYICKTMQIFATPPGGARRSIFYIDDWDFTWQNRYQYAEPLDLPAGTVIEATIGYDNSADNPNNPNDPPKRIRWGLQSTDEMGSITLLLVAADEKDTPELQRAIDRHRRDRTRRGGRGVAAGIASSLVSRLRMLDRDGDGKIQLAEVPQRWRRSVENLDLNDDGVIDENEIDAVLARTSGRRRGARGDGKDGR